MLSRNHATAVIPPPRCLIPERLRMSFRLAGFALVSSVLAVSSACAQGISIEPVSSPSSYDSSSNSHTPQSSNLSQTRYTPQALRNLAVSFLTEHYHTSSRMEAQVGHIDPRVGIKICEQPPTLEARDPTSQGGAIHVQISCQQPVAWSLYIPAVVTLYAQIPIAASDLLRGQVITEKDVIIQEVAISQYRYKILTDANALLDQELKRNIGKGAVFIPSAIAPKTLIRRNDLVAIISDNGGISITVEGTALADARLGETLRVRNNQSKRIVTGTVIASGSVKVN